MDDDPQILQAIRDAGAAMQAGSKCLPRANEEIDKLYDLLEKQKANDRQIIAQKNAELNKLHDIVEEHLKICHRKIKDQNKATTVIHATSPEASKDPDLNQTVVRTTTPHHLHRSVQGPGP